MAATVGAINVSKWRATAGWVIGYFDNQFNDFISQDKAIAKQVRRWLKLDFVGD